MALEVQADPASGLSNQEVFSQTLLELAREDPDILVVTSDSRGSGKLTGFAKDIPEQLIEVGIAEQNLVGVAAGLASTGKKVFAVSPACFLTARALEQIKNDICYSGHPVVLVGISAGVSYGALGSTHHSLHDFAVLRALNNITVVAPADNRETRACVQAAVSHPHPLYLRLGKRPIVHLHENNLHEFCFGPALMLRDGTDVAIVATGETVVRAQQASKCLAKEGVSVRLLSVPTIRPLDQHSILEAARICRVVLTVEEHSLHGGLGEAVAALLLQHRAYPVFRVLGIPDEDTVTGSQEEIFSHYGLDGPGIARTVLDLLPPS